MAMAFAPLALLLPIEIEEPNVVIKSYPDFWKDFKQLGLEINS
jgi:3-phosphoshikimate 1-carboxyvinyltransferase